MKTTNLILIATFLIILIFLVSCNNENNISDVPNADENIESIVSSDSSCEDLLNNFGNIDNFDTSVCISDSTSTPEFWVAGKLISARYNYEEAYNHHKYILEFKGINKTKTISVKVPSENMTFEINKYYKFNYGKICNNMMSMANSGSFTYHPDFLTEVEC